MKRPTTRTMVHRARTRVAQAAAAAAVALLAAPATVHAQLDPLIALKRVPPRILIVFDTSFSMLYDMTAYDRNTGLGAVYCDPAIYSRTADNAVAAALNVDPGANTYRRSFTNLAVSPAGGYAATGITVVTDRSATFANPCVNTRYEIARRGVTWALRRSGNPRMQWGLVKLRQNSPSWRIANATGCEQASMPSTVGDTNPCNTGAPGFFAINPPSVLGPNATAPVGTPLVLSAANRANTLANNFFDASTVPLPATSTQAAANRLIPAGRDTASGEDRPLANTLLDAKNEVIRAMGAEGTAMAAARNTVVVLIAAGRDYTGDPESRATEFLNVSAAGATRRVPIFVVGLSPKSFDDEAQLSRIAANSGGLYMRATNQYGVERAINLAIQAGCQRAAELDTGLPSEFPLVSPVVGTVNLENAQSATGAALPNTVISTGGGMRIPQRNNILLTSAFVLGAASLSPDAARQSTAAWNPGFEGRLRAFRVFKPVADSTKPSGYTFTKDGTPLWPNSDGRPETAGCARAPVNPDDRNIFTYIPGRGMVAFRAGDTDLQAAMNTMYAPEVINLVRRLPLGGIISSTPAVMDPPSLDPPPDDDYGRPDADASYAGLHKDRRSIIFVGANDGMLHAIDARTGYEVWAFIPYNLLPKLQALLDGQSPYEFTYFVDQSPKIAEVKMGGRWKSVLIIGEGWGGTFYQAFDVTEAGMGGPAPDSDDYHGVIASFASGTRIPFLWAFPSYSSFDPLVGGGRVLMNAADTTSFGRVKFFGDLKTTATQAEKKVGFTWSDPAVGALNATRTVNAAIVGSGYFPPEAESSTSVLAARQNAGVGRAFYLIDLATGTLIGNSGGTGGGPNTGTGCLDVGDAGGLTAKNALQADPTVTSDYGSYVAKKAYLGDLDGNYHRFTFNANGEITRTTLKATGQPIYASSALMWVGTTQQYIFFSTGSDMLPTSPNSTYGTGTFKLYALKEASGVATDAFGALPLAAVTNFVPENPAVPDVNGRTVGIPAGERPSTSPSVAGEIVFFTTTVEAGTAAGEPIYNLYAVTYYGSNGYRTSTTTGGSSGGTGSGGGSGGNAGGSSTLAPVKTGTGRATAPFVVDQHLYFATTTGSSANVEAFGDPNDFNNGVGQVGVRILSWREIRR